MINGWILKDMEVRCCGIVWGSIPEFSWEAEEYHENIRKAGIRTDIWTQDLQNVNEDERNDKR
jgi:hypothetical protein